MAAPRASRRPRASNMRGSRVPPAAPGPGGVGRHGPAHHDQLLPPIHRLRGSPPAASRYWPAPRSPIPPDNPAPTTRTRAADDPAPSRNAASGRHAPTRIPALSPSPPSIGPAKSRNPSAGVPPMPAHETLRKRMPDLPTLEPPQELLRNPPRHLERRRRGHHDRDPSELVRAMRPASSCTSAPSAPMRTTIGRSSGTPVVRLISTARVSGPAATATSPQKYPPFPVPPPMSGPRNRRPTTIVRSPMSPHATRPPIPSLTPREIGCRGAGRGALPGTVSSARRRSEAPPSRGSIEWPTRAASQRVPGRAPRPAPRHPPPRRRRARR